MNKLQDRVDLKLKVGVEHYNNFNNDSAVKVFDQIINSYNKNHHLKDKEKSILAQACTYKANIISKHSFKDETLALKYLEKAIELVPNMQDAIDLRQAILIERGRGFS
jgi:hypothetical protein